MPTSAVSGAAALTVVLTTAELIRASDVDVRRVAETVAKLVTVPAATGVAVTKSRAVAFDAKRLDIVLTTLLEKNGCAKLRSRRDW